ncbi:HEPN domain-containing protein [Pontimicrobium aquaticum]|uniref:HEPN domain-containing protein n=1 Tax=Pontimicrobium aquaticum TaxID=2565367 RepID=A0A4U0ESH6_9FLAO|nr:HEPN domain-containing protein [Pontimicrobium aquaticum]TJY34681.1 HEPN domain-containing protein [Pontimicrobium aquaticum]
MEKSITWTEKLYKGHWLMDLGYRDYIAARFLLNNHLIIQGLTLASTSVEKYLKAIIVFNLKDNERYHYHLDRFEELKNLLSKVGSDITEEFDAVFLEILQNSFKIRYYDNIKKPIFIGFYINQLIGELDYTIDFMEKHIDNSKNGGESMSRYFDAIKNNDSHLYENNFILSKENKKDFMEKPDIGFSINIRIGSVIQDEGIVKGGSTKNKYEGQISKFTEFTQNLF